MVKKILITGGIGSGKSTLSKYLSSLGYFVFDADVFAREALLRPKVLARVRDVLGPQAFLSDGSLNRPFVRDLIHAHGETKKQFEEIMHPAIEEEFSKRVEALNAIDPHPWVFYEASLILELGRKSDFDICVVVKTPAHQRVKRLMASRGLGAEHIKKMMSLQMPDKEKVAYADYVVHNSGGLDGLQKKTFALLKFLREKLSSE